MFYHRRRVPNELTGVVGKTEIWKSLRTDSFEIAKRRLPMAVASVESIFEQARAKAGFSVDDTLLKPLLDDVVEHRKLTMASEPLITFEQAYDQYLADPTHTWTTSTCEAYRTTRDMMVSIIGADLPISVRRQII